MTDAAATNYVSPSTSAVEQFLRSDANGMYPLQGHIAQASSTTQNPGVLNPLVPVQIADFSGGATSTFTLPLNMSNYVGRKFTIANSTVAAGRKIGIVCAGAQIIAGGETVLKTSAILTADATFGVIEFFVLSPTRIVITNDAALTFA